MLENSVRDIQNSPSSNFASKIVGTLGVILGIFILLYQIWFLLWAFDPETTATRSDPDKFYAIVTLSIIGIVLLLAMIFSSFAFIIRRKNKYGLLVFAFFLSWLFLYFFILPLTF
jgi:hypothetical protein